MENMDTGFQEFASAFGVDAGNQTATVEETTAPETTEGAEEETEVIDDEGTEAAESDEPTEEENTQEADKDGAEASDSGDSGISEQKFTIKVNKETREVGLEEMTELAQKGADYDRVKEQLAAERQTNQSLREEADKNRLYMEMLESAAQASGLTVEALVESVQVNLRMSRDGLSEKEAKATIRAEIAERKAQELTQKQEQEKAAKEEEDNRAEREIAEFSKNFPGVQLTDDQINAMRPYVQNGMSMTSAYLKIENDRIKAEMEAQQAKAKADAQNKKNRSKATRSQKDSGGAREKSEFDEFLKAFKS